MSLTIDFLPPAYRQRLQRAQARRELALLAIPIAIALAVTDHVLRRREHIVAGMARQAAAHADLSEQQNEQVRQLAQRLAATQSRLEGWAAPLAAPRMTALLDALTADRPAGITLHDLSCRHDPWGSNGPATIRLDASSRAATDFTRWLTHLQSATALPPLQCQRTAETADGALTFHLETTTTGLPR